MVAHIATDEGAHVKKTIQLGWAMVVMAGCTQGPDTEALVEALENGDTQRVAADVGDLAAGELLFNEVTFDGNGRTCATCHVSTEGGTVSPDFIEAAFQADPDGPLFVGIDSDDRNGATFDRMRENATFLIDFDLPDGLFICGELPSDCVCVDGQCEDSGITSLTLPRAATATLNNPGLETRFMTDGRFSDLQNQALGAVNQHFEPGRQPTPEELELIELFQQDDRQFYSSSRLRAAGRTPAPLPKLPNGRNASQRRGKAFFENTPEGLCGHCHGGPFLNESTDELLAPPGLFPPGTRVMPLAQVSLLNPGDLPVYTYCFDDAGSDAQGTFDICADPFFSDFGVGVPATRSNPFGAVPMVSPDPGLALTTGQPIDFSAFRIPTLWGVADTAPYFHDNSAADLEEMMDHYVEYFAGPPAFRQLTDQEVDDIIAYLQLLR